MDFLDHASETGIRENLRTTCTDATAMEVARFVIQKMDREADEDTLEYDFHIMQGEMQVDPAYAERNTWFKFDVGRNNPLADVKKAMYESECTDEELLFIEDFNKKVAHYVKHYYAKDVERILRRVMFRGKDIPIKLERVTSFEVIDFSGMPDEHNYQLLVDKRVPKSAYANGDLGASVTEELFRINRETGEGFNAIIRRKKAEGDENYKWVHGATTKKMLWESQIDMFVNYMAMERPADAPPKTIR